MASPAWHPLRVLCGLPSPADVVNACPCLTYLLYACLCLWHQALDEIHAGVCDGLTYAEVKEKFLSVHEERALDKLRYR